MTEPAGRGALRALVLQHEEATPPGHVTEWLGGHGAEMDVFRIDLDEPKADPEDYDLIVSLGSEFAAYDDSHRFVTT
jgi:GMP synthase-like glutamine amidotransferase